MRVRGIHPKCSTYGRRRHLSKRKWPGTNRPSEPSSNDPSGPKCAQVSAHSGRRRCESPWSLACSRRGPRSPKYHDLFLVSKSKFKFRFLWFPFFKEYLLYLCLNIYLMKHINEEASIDKRQLNNYSLISLIRMKNFVQVGVQIAERTHKYCD